MNKRLILKIALFSFFLIFVIYELYFHRMNLLDNYEKNKINDVVLMTINGYDEQLFKFSKEADFMALNIGNKNSYEIKKGDSIVKKCEEKKITVFRKIEGNWLKINSFDIK